MPSSLQPQSLCSMKLAQHQINNAYGALGQISLGNVAPADIAKIMRARKAMRPIYEAYVAFDTDVRKAQANYDILAELESKGKARTEVENLQYDTLLPDFVKAVNEAIIPELKKEFDLDIEQISEEAVAQIASNNNLSAGDLEVIGCVIER